MIHATIHAMSVHELTVPNTDSLLYGKTRFHYLLQIVFGETMAVDYCRTIATFAPNSTSRDFLLRQQSEEDVHLELLTDYIEKHSRPSVPVSGSLRKLHNVMAKQIEKKDYITSVFVQNFIVEGLMSLFLESLNIILMAN